MSFFAFIADGKNIVIDTLAGYPDNSIIKYSSQSFLSDPEEIDDQNPNFKRSIEDPFTYR
jgi:hypothetical protein